MSAIAAHAPYAAPAAHMAQGDVDEGMQQEARATLLVTTVDIGEGRAGRIELLEGDDPVDVARAFCQRHGLPESIVLPLAQHLEDNLAESVSGEQEEYEEEGEVQDSEEQEASLMQAEDSQQTAEDVMPRASDSPINVPSARATSGSTAAGSQLRRQGSDVSAAASTRQPQQLPAHSVGSMQSSPTDSKAMPQTSASVGQQSQQVSEQPSSIMTTSQAGLPTYRPACINSSLGAEYFNRPIASSKGTATAAASEGMQYSSGTVNGGHIPSMSNVSTAAMPAHNRLYAAHFKKQQRLEEERRLRDLEIQLKMEQVHIAPTSNKLASHRTAGSYRNYGERLYVEGRLEAMKKEQLAQRVKEEEERAEYEQYSFQPEITRMAQQIKKTEEEMGAASAYQRLYQRANGTAKRQERMEAIRREQEEAEMKDCSFRPQVCSKSMRLVEQRQQILKESGLKSYDHLYNENLRRKMKLEHMQQQLPPEATFRPKVNTSSVVLKKLMEGREGDSPLKGSGDVATRLLERGRKYQEKLQTVQRLQEEQPRDPTTGQLLFRPKTHRAPTYLRNPEGAPIGEYLYSIKAEWDEKAARVQDAKERRMNQDASSSFVNNRSEKMVDRLKRDRFRAIFDYLRRGNSGSMLNLLHTVQDESFMDTIDPEVRADIEYAGRILAKDIARRQVIEDSAASAPAHILRGPYGDSLEGDLDADGFVTLMEEVINRTKGLTRQYLLPMPSSRQKFEEPTFRPAIDPRSQMLAARLRPATLPTHELLYKTAEELAAKREEMKRAAEEAKLKECLFHPVIVAERRAKEGKAIKMAETLIQSKRGSVEEGASAEAAAADIAAQAAEQGEAAMAAVAAQLQQAVAQVAQESAAEEAADAAAVAASSKGGEGEEVHFDALEQQINEALVRLSLTEEQVAASLQVAVNQSVDANGYRLDFRAICGSPSPTELQLAGFEATPSQQQQQSAHADPALDFNPLFKADAAAMSCQTRSTSVQWTEGSEHHVVANVMHDGGMAELAGLDLHALASTDLPEHHGHGSAEESTPRTFIGDEGLGLEGQDPSAKDLLLISPISQPSPAHSSVGC